MRFVRALRPTVGRSDCGLWVRILVLYALKGGWELLYNVDPVLVSPAGPCRWDLVSPVVVLPPPTYLVHK